MAKTVNTSPQSKARATLPLLERLRRVLEHFMQPHTRAKKTKSKGLLALLQLLCQYSMGAGYMPLAMGCGNLCFLLCTLRWGLRRLCLRP
ncbi:hypothetical protein [Acetobacter ascendens]|uniref:Uncharacterized protein n=1 Tax=Acetobacter ascendens TaxID=481146 RepID=A0A1Y0UV39_9PROT|nr:hypothetical protein [Acetobacter ascendens]ARW09750.1 hypothetical protein S101447_00647 [Acetobacter ascendens]